MPREKPEELLVRGAAQLGLTLSSDQRDRFLDYLEFLQEWNRRISLTSLKDPRSIVIRHFLDSLSCSGVMSGCRGMMADIGAGAGFPSLPLKLVMPELQVILIEANRKKAGFLKALVEHLELAGVEIIDDRAERSGRGPLRAQCDWVVCRAVGRLRVVIEYALPLLRVGGVLIAQKGGDIEVEVREAQGALDAVGGILARVVPLAVPFLPDVDRTLVVVTKDNLTPSRYPRRVGVPVKRPL